MLKTSILHLIQISSLYPIPAPSRGHGRTKLKWRGRLHGLTLTPHLSPSSTGCCFLLCHGEAEAAGKEQKIVPWLSQMAVLPEVGGNCCFCSLCMHSRWLVWTDGGSNMVHWLKTHSSHLIVPNSLAKQTSKKGIKMNITFCISFPFF